MPAASFTRGTILELTIDKMTFGNAGLGRYQGLVVFVPYVIAGEKVRVKLVDVKTDYAKAELVEVLESSAHRRSPPCEYYGQCGGCDWQHMTYPAQIASKKQVLESVIQRQKVPWPHEVRVLEADQEWNYRNRIQVHDTGKEVGFRQKGSHTTIPIKQCLIAETSVNKQLSVLTPKRIGRFEIRSEIDNLSGFEQVNSAQNEKLQSWIEDTAKKFQPKTILDLYCGSGNLSFPAMRSPGLESLVGVESHADSIAKANSSAKKFKLSYLSEFITSDVHKYLATISECAELVIMDPPREGAGTNVMTRLHQLDVQNLIYVSCDPMTWARDVKHLLKLDPNWQIKELAGLDLFPQTHHIEILSILNRN